MNAELEQHEAAWAQKGLLRRVYAGWHREIERRLSTVPGETVELGSGIGRLKDTIPHVVLTDVEPTERADLVVSAEALPFPDGSLANLIMTDVFHHLERPATFLDEAVRALAPGGRVILLEPYCSPISTFAYRRFHHEDLSFDTSGLERDEALAGSPWTANIARPTVAFFRHREEISKRWPPLVITERRLLTSLAYPLSGGYSRRALAPAFLYPALAALERLLSPLLPLIAFRCLVVLERR
jgi:SAM-dependent methyltransferase